MAKTIDIKDFIDERPISAFQWVLVAMCFLVVVADGMDVAIMGFVTPSDPSGVEHLAAGLRLRNQRGAVRPRHRRPGRGPVVRPVRAQDRPDDLCLPLRLLHRPRRLVVLAQEMALLRLLAGMGMGAAMPNATTLLSEYAPLRRRSLMITIMFSGFNLGSAAIGFAAGYMIPLYGWRSVLLVGGIVAARRWFPCWSRCCRNPRATWRCRAPRREKIAATLGRVTGHRFSGGETFVSNEPPLHDPQADRRPVLGWLCRDHDRALGHLFHGPAGHLPADRLAADADEGRRPYITTAANVTAMFQIGGTIGAVLVGWSMDRARPARVIAAAYLSAGPCASCGSQDWARCRRLARDPGFRRGLLHERRADRVERLRSRLLSTVARATGVSWMLGMGRFGSIVGSSVGGALLGLGWGFGAILGILAIPAICAAIAIALTQRGSAGRGQKEAAGALARQNP